MILGMKGLMKFQNWNHWQNLFVISVSIKKCTIKVGYSQYCGLQPFHSCFMHMYYFQFAKKRSQLENANLYIVDKPFFFNITINRHLRDFYVIVLTASVE